MENVSLKRMSPALPAHSLNWLVTSRLNFITDMKAGKPLKFFSAHLPVMATWPKSGCNANTGSMGDGGPKAQTAPDFPLNMTVKGIGLIPKAEQLQYYTELFETVAASCRTLPPNESISQRVDAMAGLYSDAANFDPSLMGGLEIFAGKALANLYENALASLLYVGMERGDGGMNYVSFQVNGEITIIEKGNEHYRYLLASRKLFEYDVFHLYQPDYPYGYLIEVKEVLDKSPWSRHVKNE